MKKASNCCGMVMIVLFTAVGVVACEQRRPHQAEIAAHELVRSAREAVPVAYSNNHHVALVSAEVACVVNSFEVSVHCVDSFGARRWEVGSGEGDGPGEFRTIGSLVRGEAGRLGIVDLALSRLSVFDVQGDLISVTRVPPLFRPVKEIGSTIEGTGQTPGVAAAGGELFRIEVEEGNVLEVISLAHPFEAGAEVEAVRGLSHGTMDTAGMVWFGTGVRELVGYHDDGRLFGVVVAPLWSPDGPSADEVQVFARTPLFGQLPSADDVAEFARAPQRYLVPGRSLVADDRGRIWALTQRRSFAGSAIDVYRSGGFLGTVRTGGRALGFDVLGEHIVVL
jgi:hypothetical protein